MAATAVVAIALCVLAPLRPTSGDTVAARLGGAELRCGGSFDLYRLDWIKQARDSKHTPYYVWGDDLGEITSIFGPAPAVVASIALLDFGDSDSISDRTLRQRERDAAAVLLALGVALLVLAAAARSTWRRAVLTGAVAMLSFAGAATLGQGLWQATVALPPLVGALATLAWRERIPRVALATPALLVLAVMLRPTIAPLGLGMGIAWAVQARGWRIWLVAAGLALVVAAPLVAWNIVHLWSPFPVAQFEANARFTHDHAWQLSPLRIAAGIGGLVVSPGRGLVWFAPIALVGAWVARRSPHRIIALAVVGQIAAMALFYKWHGGFAYGPRLVAEAVWVAIWLALGAGLELPRRTGQLAIAITLVVGQLGLWRFRDEQWEARRLPDDHEVALWDFVDSPIAATLTSPDTPPRLDSPIVGRLHCVNGSLYTLDRQ